MVEVRGEMDGKAITVELLFKGTLKYIYSFVHTQLLYYELEYGLEYGVTTCKRTKWIMLIYTLNPDSIQIQPTSRGGMGY